MGQVLHELWDAAAVVKGGKLYRPSPVRGVDLSVKEGLFSSLLVPQTLAISAALLFANGRGCARCDEIATADLVLFACKHR